MKIFGVIGIALVTVAAAYIKFGGNMTRAEAQAPVAHCLDAEIRRMTGALAAIFPDVKLGALERSACLDVDMAGVDSSGALVFDASTTLDDIPLRPVTVDESVPIAQVADFLPDLDLNARALDYLYAYGFDRDWNSGVYVLRRADATGPVIFLVSDLM